MHQLTDLRVSWWLRNMIHDQRSACFVSLCVHHSKWAYCFTICRKRLGSFPPLWPKFITFPTKSFLIKKKKKAWWKQRTALWARKWNQQVQRRSLEIIMHTGTHSDNSKINQHQEKCYTVCLCELEKELITCGRLAAVQTMRNCVFRFCEFISEGTCKLAVKDVLLVVMLP